MSWAIDPCPQGLLDTCPASRHGEAAKRKADAMIEIAHLFWRVYYAVRECHQPEFARCARNDWLKHPMRCDAPSCGSDAEGHHHLPS